MVKLVNKISGVVSSDALWQKQRLTVQIDSAVNVDDESIFDAIRRGNFTPGKRLDGEQDK